MKQGTTPTKKINLSIENNLIENIIFTVKDGNFLLHKRYPAEVAYQDGLYWLNFTQEETEPLQGHSLIEAQITLTGGAVAKTETKPFFIESSIYTEIEGDHAGGVDDDTIKMASADVISVESASGPIYASDVIGLNELIPQPMTEQELRRILEGV